MGNTQSNANPSQTEEFKCDHCGQKFSSYIVKILHEDDCEAKLQASAVETLMTLQELEIKRQILEDFRRSLLEFNVTMEMLENDDENDDVEDESKKYLLGARVVRSASWKWGNQDGGEGHVGTVIKIVGEKVNVLWDGGANYSYRAGMDGSCDLLILDSRPAGVKHENVSCDGCVEKDDCLRGARWKCHDCEDIDLCTLCFMAKKHDLKHRFIRFDDPESSGLLLPPRDTIAARVRSRGLFHGAVVQRGMHWGWSAQDGGPGKQGTIIEITGFRDPHAYDAAIVIWSNQNVGKYMVGCDNEVDLKCVSPANGPLYYKDLLHPCGSTQENTKERPFDIGDIVEIKFHPTQMKRMQKGHGGWQNHMVVLMNKHGRVFSIDSDNDVLVKYDRWDLAIDFGDDKCIAMFNPAVLKKVTDPPTPKRVSKEIRENVGVKELPGPSSPPGSQEFKEGDVVRCTLPVSTLKDFMVAHTNTWSDEMEKMNGKKATVCAIKPDGIVSVKYRVDDRMGLNLENTIFYYHKEVLQLVPGEEGDTLSPAIGTDKSGSTREEVEDQEATAPGYSSTEVCWICEEKDSTVIFRPCGHKILCQDCSLFSRMKRCLDCRTEITKKELPCEEQKQKLKTKLEEIKESQTCAICKDRKRNVAFTPCGHSSCDECCPGLEQQCHICREGIKSVLKLY